MQKYTQRTKARSSHPEVFLGKGVMKICSKIPGEHPCRSVELAKYTKKTPRHYAIICLNLGFKGQFSKQTSR